MFSALKSIRWTLQLWHAAILAAALASFGTALYLAASREQVGRVDRELETAAQVLVGMPLGRPFGGGGPGGGMPPPEEFGSPDPNGRPDPGSMGMRSPWGPRGPGGAGGPLAAESADRGPRGTGGRPPMDSPDHGPGGLGGRGGRMEFVIEQWWTHVRQDVLRRIGQSEQDQPYFVIWGQRGEVLRTSDANLTVPAPALPARIPGPSMSPQFRQREGLREVILQGPFGTRVLVGKSLRSEEAAIRRLLWSLLMAGAAVMAVGLYGGWWLSKRALRPIAVISDTARTISGSDLSRRITVRETESELGSLCRPSTRPLIAWRPPFSGRSASRRMRPMNSGRPCRSSTRTRSWP